ncbi:MAG: type II toxin-antitoxin system RelE/ParE family toxin [Halarsenatibacteraceae bacterium]
MSKYQVEITKAVEDDLEGLKNLRSEAVRKLLDLENNPKDKTSSLSGNLKGLRSFKFKLSEGSYRAILKLLEDNSICLLILVGPRENLYRKAARRVKILKKHELI